MFRAQIEELRSMVEVKEADIAQIEESIKAKKEELRDVKQALASLERVQGKYEPIRLAKISDVESDEEFTTTV